MASRAIVLFVNTEYIANVIVVMDASALHKIKTDIKFSALNNLYSNATTATDIIPKTEYIKRAITINKLFSDYTSE